MLGWASWAFPRFPDRFQWGAQTAVNRIEGAVFGSSQRFGMFHTRFERLECTLEVRAEFFSEVAAQDGVESEAGA